MKPLNAIEIRGLRKTFSKFSLGPIEMTVPRGAIYGFIGPNGAGKTTTIDMIFGMGYRDSGSITVLGMETEAQEVEAKRKMAYVSPELNHMAWGKVGKALRFFQGFYPTWDEEYCAKLLTNLKLDPNDRIASLSFGSKIKLSLIIALSWRPEVLILDEPTVGLDAITKQQVFGELLNAVDDGERTVLISSHGLTDLERFTDHIGLINQGRMVLEGSTADVVERFRMVDFTSDKTLNLEQQPGLFLQKEEHHRSKVLVDTRTRAMEWLQAQGAQMHATSAVTLEELFIALVR